MTVSVQYPTDEVMVTHLHSSETGPWRDRILAAVIGGLIGGLLMGALLHLGNTMGLIGILYGQGSDVTVGWIGHLFHSVLFAVLFAGIVSLPPVLRLFEWSSDVMAGRLGPHISRFGEQLPSSAYVTGVIFGAVYAVALWIVAFGYILTWRSGQVGFIRWQPLEWLEATAPGALLAHLVYGILLAIVYVGVVRWRRTSD